jgi:two-component system LytT family sensor kinase
MLRFRAFLVSIHIAGWLIFMALPLLFMNAWEEGNNFHLLSFFYYWVFCVTYIVLFYLNSYILIPRLFLQKKYLNYTIVILLLFAGVYALQPYDRLVRSNEKQFGIPFMLMHQPGRDKLLGLDMAPPQHHDTAKHPVPGGLPPGHAVPPFTNEPERFFHHPGPNQMRRHFDIISFFLFIMIIALSTAIRIVRQWQLSEQRARQAESDKTDAELSFLRAQINPHFLFNTLNNIYTLAVIQDEHAPDSILKLSNIMRYVTDDTREDFVPLQYEIDCINDYIELQKLRLGKNTRIDFKITGDVDSKQIAPLILMTFIENVFKYGISKHESSIVSINILVHENGISFYCQNRIFQEKEYTERAGIGLDNVKQRLHYLYPGKYVLNINTENHLYTVNLILRA